VSRPRRSPGVVLMRCLSVVQPPLLLFHHYPNVLLSLMLPDSKEELSVTNYKSDLVYPPTLSTDSVVSSLRITSYSEVPPRRITKSDHCNKNLKIVSLVGSMETHTQAHDSPPFCRKYCPRTFVRYCVHRQHPTACGAVH